jgi:hypothetical protein
VRALLNTSIASIQLLNEALRGAEGQASIHGSWQLDNLPAPHGSFRQFLSFTPHEPLRALGASGSGSWSLSDSEWEPPRASGRLWNPLGASGSLWEPLEASGSRWEPLGASGESLGASGSLWEPGASASLWEPQACGSLREPRQGRVGKRASFETGVGGSTSASRLKLSPKMRFLCVVGLGFRVAYGSGIWGLGFRALGLGSEGALRSKLSSKNGKEVMGKPCGT